MKDQKPPEISHRIESNELIALHSQYEPVIKEELGLTYNLNQTND